jgi:bisphosphoglycerate-independent phosphoglycerate mutase (AlkP superfamily)
MTQQDLYEGRALAADFTGSGWRTMLRLDDTPVLDERTAGHRLAALARQNDFSLFEYWASDYAGHKQDMVQAVALMESFDRVLGGVLESWTDSDGLILLTSDHGNMEDLSTRRHTHAPVPGLIIGERSRRNAFAAGLNDITGIAPAIWRTMTSRPDATLSL